MSDRHWNFFDAWLCTHWHGREQGCCSVPVAIRISHDYNRVGLRRIDSRVLANICDQPLALSRIWHVAAVQWRRIHLRKTSEIFSQILRLPFQLQESYTRPKYLAGCIFACLFIIVGNTAPNCLVFAEYIVTAFNPSAEKLDDRLLKFVALVCVTFICTLHIFSRKVGIATNNGWFHALFLKAKLIKI